MPWENDIRPNQNCIDKYKNKSIYIISEIFGQLYKTGIHSSAEYYVFANVPQLVEMMLVLNQAKKAIYNDKSAKIF